MEKCKGEGARASGASKVAVVAYSHEAANNFGRAWPAHLPEPKVAATTLIKSIIYDTIKRVAMSWHDWTAAVLWHMDTMAAVSCYAFQVCGLRMAPKQKHVADGELITPTKRRCKSSLELSPASSTPGGDLHRLPLDDPNGPWIALLMSTVSLIHQRGHSLHEWVFDKVSAVVPDTVDLSQVGFLLIGRDPVDGSCERLVGCLSCKHLYTNHLVRLGPEAVDTNQLHQCLRIVVDHHAGVATARVDAQHPRFLLPGSPKVSAFA